MLCYAGGAVICTVFPEEEKERQRLQLLAPTTNNVVVYYTLRTFFQGEFVCHIGGQLLMIYGTPDSFLYHSVLYSVYNYCIHYTDRPTQPSSTTHADKMQFVFQLSYSLIHKKKASQFTLGTFLIYNFWFLSLMKVKIFF